MDGKSIDPSKGIVIYLTRHVAGEKVERVLQPDETLGRLARAIESEIGIPYSNQTWIVADLEPGAGVQNGVGLFQPEEHRELPLSAWHHRTMMVINATNPLPSFAKTDTFDPESYLQAEAAKRSVKISIVVQGQEHEKAFEPDETLEEMSRVVESQFKIAVSNQKYFVPGLGMFQPLNKPNAPLVEWHGKRVKVMGTPAKDLAAFQAIERKVIDRDAARREARRARRNLQSRVRQTKSAFRSIMALPHLPNSHLSELLLKRLTEDRGIKTVMEKYKFEVGILAEMEPLANTQETHEGVTRLLGLNHNKGQIIELRLRTDAHDGYRDYNTIRKTLCHELTHNVHGDHDRKFWDLCHQIEREVHAANVGHTIGDASGPYVPSPEEDVDDHGGLMGGTYVLGGRAQTPGLSTREILAQAAEKRKREMDEDGPDGGNQSSSPAG